jgi:lactoylglutathione lyase
MAIKHVSSVTHYVRDQETALDFFVNKCGFEKRQDEAFSEGDQALRWLEVAPPGAQTVVVLSAGFAEWSEDRLGKFSGIVFWADDMQATYEKMVANGVVFNEPPTAQPWGLTQAIFQDQDGTSIVMVGSN